MNNQSRRPPKAGEITRSQIEFLQDSFKRRETISTRYAEISEPQNVGGAATIVGIETTLRLEKGMRSQWSNAKGKQRLSTP